jgi:hypothetical protein
VRLDPAGDATHLAPGRTSLLRAFAAWGRQVVAPAPDPAPPVERRAVPRRHVECLAWVGWKSWRRFHMNDALVVNISRGGALVFLDAPPPTDRDVWVFLESPERNAVVKARVQQVQTTATGQCAAHVGFAEPCPYAFFEAAVCGQHAADPRARKVASAGGSGAG